MRRWLTLAARLYPRAWRERYGAEFDALMEDVRPDWRELANVVRGALVMHLTNGIAWWKLAAITAAAGAAIGGVAVLSMPGRYVSSATVRYSGDPTRLSDTVQEAMSRKALSEIIQDPAFDLYRDQRNHESMEDVVRTMARDILVRKNVDQTYSIVYAGSDPVKAQAVVNRLVTRVRDRIEGENHARAVQWEVWQRRVGATDPPPSSHQSAQWTILSSPRTGVASARPWPPFAMAGFAAGALLGLVMFALVRRPRWTMTTLACAAGGCLIALGVSLLVPEWYRSSAMLRVDAPLDPARWYGANPPTRADRVSQVLRESFGGDPRGRNNVTFRMVDGESGTFEMAFEDHNPHVAQAGVQELVTRISDRITADEHRRVQASGDDVRVMAELGIGERLVSVDPPTLPQAPLRPARRTLLAIGWGLGLIAGLVVGRHVSDLKVVQ